MPVAPPQIARFECEAAAPQASPVDISRTWWQILGTRSRCSGAEAAGDGTTTDVGGWESESVGSGTLRRKGADIARLPLTSGRNTTTDTHRDLAKASFPVAPESGRRCLSAHRLRSYRLRLLTEERRAETGCSRRRRLSDQCHALVTGVEDRRGEAAREKDVEI